MEVVDNLLKTLNKPSCDLVMIQFFKIADITKLIQIFGLLI